MNQELRTCVVGKLPRFVWDDLDARSSIIEYVLGQIADEFNKTDIKDIDIQVLKTFDDHVEVGLSWPTTNSDMEILYDTGLN